MNKVKEYQAPQTPQNRIHPAGERLMPSRDLLEYFQQYARERPEVVALWCLGVGFVLGWKLKLW